MDDPTLSQLAEWENFCVIVGSSGAALTGLMFVVIALGAERGALKETRQLRAFATPNVLHFCTVLLVASLFSIPHQTATTLGLCLKAIGAAGLALVVWVVVQARKQRGYHLVAEDWLWHVALPVLAYGAMLAGAFLLREHVDGALDAAALATLLLLFIGIHNAWDTAVYIAVDR